MKSIVGLFLGIVLLLSQVQLCPAREIARPNCEMIAASSCCSGKSVCACSHDEGKKAPLPAVPAAIDLKFTAPKARELDDFARPQLLAAVQMSVVFRAQNEVRSGFAGVPFSVAFCSFVI